MPTLDVSFVLDDPLFSEPLVCLRTDQAVNSFGEAEQSETQTRFFGVVTVAAGERVDRTGDAERSGEGLTVHTRFRLVGVHAGGQPDIVVRDGLRYEVQAVHDWSRYGAGFVMAELSALPLMGKA